jgi:hypothetical protein
MIQRLRVQTCIISAQSHPLDLRLVRSQGLCVSFEHAVSSLRSTYVYMSPLGLLAPIIIISASSGLFQRCMGMSYQRVSSQGESDPEHALSTIKACFARKPVVTSA